MDEARPSRTINRLHFTDLHDRRFEDLCLQLVYRQHDWEDIHHDGRAGSDEGVDIRGIERLEDGTFRRWHVQCRRYHEAGPQTLKDAVDDCLARSDEIPDVILVVVGCDVSKRARDEFEHHADSRGVGLALLWTASKLETFLYSDYPDLLFTFFGLSVPRSQRISHLIRAPSIAGNVSLFFDPSQPFAVHEGYRSIAKDLFLQRGATLYLRLIPMERQQERSTSQADQIVRISRLVPMSDAASSGGALFIRNRFGAASAHADWESGRLLTFSQLFKRTRELWGVDADTINKEVRMAWSGVDFGYIPCVSVEDVFEHTLRHYLYVAEHHLGLSLPLAMIAGVTGVEGYKMALTRRHFDRFGGRFIEDTVEYE